MIIFANLRNHMLIINNMVPDKIHIAAIRPERIVAPVLVDIFPSFYTFPHFLAV